MVHVSGDGQVVPSTPWSLSRIVGGIFNAITLFFSTLISPASTNNGSGRSQGSGSGNPSYGSGSGLNPRRQIGRINHKVNIPIPGCRSCQG